MAQAAACIAPDGRGVRDLPPSAPERLLKGHFKRVFEVRAAMIRATALAPAEERFEDIAQVAEIPEIRLKPAEAAGDAPLGHGTEAVVGRPFFPVRKDLVGLVDLLELTLVPGRPVGMILMREPAVRLLDLLLAGAPRHAQNVVVIFGHGEKTACV